MGLEESDELDRAFLGTYVAGAHGQSVRILL